jgi:hypothetical protein
MADTRDKGERHVSIRFPVDVLEALRRLAKQHERSLNGEVLWALREYLQRHQERRPEQS